MENFTLVTDGSAPPSDVPCPRSLLLHLFRSSAVAKVADDALAASRSIVRCRHAKLAWFSLRTFFGDFHIDGKLGLEKAHCRRRRLIGCARDRKRLLLLRPRDRAANDRRSFSKLSRGTQIAASDGRHVDARRALKRIEERPCDRGEDLDVLCLRLRARPRQKRVRSIARSRGGLCRSATPRSVDRTSAPLTTAPLRCTRIDLISRHAERLMASDNAGGSLGAGGGARGARSLETVEREDFLREVVGFDGACPRSGLRRNQLEIATAARGSRS